MKARRDQALLEEREGKARRVRVERTPEEKGQVKEQEGAGEMAGGR